MEPPPVPALERWAKDCSCGFRVSAMSVEAVRVAAADHDHYRTLVAAVDEATGLPGTDDEPPA
jgi:hypothetical protein